MSDRDVPIAMSDTPKPFEWGYTSWAPEQCPAGWKLWTFCTHATPDGSETSRRGSTLCGSRAIHRYAEGPRCAQHTAAQRNGGHIADIADESHYIAHHPGPAVTPRRFPAGTMSDEIGPCARCGNPIIRYGANGTGTLCPACRAAMPPDRYHHHHASGRPDADHHKEMP